MQLDSLRATTETKEITYRIAYGLRLTDMHKWGLYVSHPRNIRETEHPFPEPAMFLINPEGQVQIAEYSNSPFCRPDLRIMIEGKHLSLPLLPAAGFHVCAAVMQIRTQDQPPKNSLKSIVNQAQHSNKLHTGILCNVFAGAMHVFHDALECSCIECCSSINLPSIPTSSACACCFCMNLC